MPRPIDPEREAAVARGDARYISTRPCPKGHFERFTASAGCYICQRERQTARRATEAKKPFVRSAKLREERIAAIEGSKTVHTPPWLLELTDYARSTVARDASDRLDQRIRDLTASASKTEPEQPVTIEKPRRLSSPFHIFNSGGRQ